MSDLIVHNTTIRRDAEGRYSLNDLHQAAGGEQRHQPRYWLANQQAQDLIAEMGDSENPLSVQRGGSDQGTYVAEELVIAYASWISAEFHLQVIRTFIAARQPQRSLSPAEILMQQARMMLDIEQRQATQEKVAARLEAKVEGLEERNTIQDRCPPSCEPITAIRKRIHDRYGLSAATVDEVIRQLPYAPRPALQVRNQHESAGGSTYAVYYRADVTKLFDRFMREAEQVTATLYEHPGLEARFRASARPAQTKAA